MNFFKHYLSPNKKATSSSKASSSSSGSYSAQNRSRVLNSLWNSPQFDGSDDHSSHRNRKRSAKSSPLPLGNGTPTRMGLVGSAKVIQTLGADNLEEAVEILAILQRSTLSPHSVDSFGSSEDPEESDLIGQTRQKMNLNAEVLAIKTSYTPAVYGVYSSGHIPTGWLTAYGSYRDCEMDGGSGFSTSISDYRNVHDSPQLSPHVANHHRAHPLPTPPPSPSISDIVLRFDWPTPARVAPQKLPLPPLANVSEKEHEIRPRSQHNNPWKMSSHSLTSSSSNSSPGARLSPVSVPKCPTNWTKGKFLGKGSFGSVYEGLNTDDGSFFAVKISAVETAAPEVRQEIDVLSKLDHPNIVRYLGSSVEDSHLCIFLELVGMGSLRSVLNKYKQFEENMIRTYTRQILWGLEYLHQQNTIHRDIKCANILVDPNGQVKLADFGVAKQMSQSLANSCKGTPTYMAPEIMKPSTDSRRYGLAVDIWSLGCTIIEMADGKAPWSDLEGFSFFFKVNQGELPPIPRHLSLEATDFIRSCLKLKPEERPNVSELLHHPFVVNAPAVPPPLHL